MVHLFIHLLLSANHKDSSWRDTTIKRGQIVAGRLSLSKETGISEQTLRTCIARLKSTGEITIESTSQYSIITICNYDSYQSQDRDDNQEINQETNQRSTNDQPTINHKQEDKNIRSKESTPLTPQMGEEVQGEFLKPNPLEIPPSLNTPNFTHWWAKWMDARKGMGKKPKSGWDAFFCDQLNWLSKFTSEVACGILETSTINRYQGLIPPKNYGTNQITKPNPRNIGCTTNTANQSNLIVAAAKRREAERAATYAMPNQLAAEVAEPRRDPSTDSSHGNGG